jgi:hypothetical protein
VLCELEAVALRLVVFEVVVRVAQLLHNRVAKHACVVKPAVRGLRISALHFRSTVPLLWGHAFWGVVTLSVSSEFKEGVFKSGPHLSMMAV